MGRYCKASVREGGPANAGRGGILERLRPLPSSASTSCESAVRGPHRGTTPSLPTKPLSQDAAVVPPATPGTTDLMFWSEWEEEWCKGSESFSLWYKTGNCNNSSHPEVLSVEEDPMQRAIPLLPPPTQVIHWVRQCEQKDLATAHPPCPRTVPAWLREGNSSQNSSQLGSAAVRLCLW